MISIHTQSLNKLDSLQILARMILLRKKDIKKTSSSYEGWSLNGKINVL